jgi:uridylate kinase
MTSVPAPSVAEPYIRLKAIHHLNKGYIVIFGGGNGQPFVTTNYPSVQRAIEMDCDALFVAKQGVDGVFTNDPKKDPHAKMYKTFNYNDVVQNNINIMDQSALLLARDFHLPVHIFNFNEKNAMKRLCDGEEIGTLIHHGKTELLES